MKVIIYLQTVMIVLVLFACTGNSGRGKENVDNDKVFEFIAEPKSIDENVAFSDIVERYKYIVLETTEECLIGKIEKFIINNSRIYIQSGGVFCFDMDGNFLYSINNRGKGPGEFIKIYSFSIDNNIIYIYDNTQARLLCYNSDNGNYIDTYKVPYSTPSIEILDSSWFVDTHQFPKSMFPDSFNGQERLFRLSFDNLLKPLNKFFPEKRFKLIAEGQGYVSGGNYFFIDPYMLEVYQFAKDRMVPFFSVNWPGKNLSEADVLGLINRRLTITQLVNQDMAISLNSVLETRTQIYSNLIVNAKMCFLIYEKKSHKCRVIDCWEIKREDYQPGIGYGGAKCIYGDYICTIGSYNQRKFTNFNLNNLVENGYERKEVLKPKSINENSNPVISLMKIKAL
jgi:hypothetical protein